MGEIKTLQRELVNEIRRSSAHNPDIQFAPACTLWPDKDRQWEVVIPALQGVMPELLTLGEYDPTCRSGPAIWLKCVIAGTLEDVDIPENHIPVIYLPGISRTELKAIERCPDTVKPLAELQFRGVLWGQHNGKDWTANAYLTSSMGGLGLDVAKDKVAAYP